MCIIHLFTLGYRHDDLLSFKLSLNNPSKIAELQELEHLRTKFDIAGAATEGYFSKRWVYKNIFKIDDDEVERIQMEQYSDSKHNAVLESTGTAAGEAATTAAGPMDGAEGEGDMGEDLGLEDEGGEGAPEDGAPDEDAAEEGPLLSEPGQRDDWYTPVTTPKWKQGARKRSYLSSAGNNLASSSTDNLFKGWSREMGPLSRGVVGESSDREEKMVFQTQANIRVLIEELEKKSEKT